MKTARAFSRVTGRVFGVGLVAALTVSAILWNAGVHAQTLQKVRIGTGATALQPAAADLLLPQYLGYYKEEGLDMELVPLGSSVAALSALDSKRIEAYSGSGQFVIPLAAKGDKVRAVAFFELLYPFRYSLAVKPGTSYKSLTDLKGKTIGVSNFGLGDYPMGKQVFKLGGLDPENGVNWLATGNEARPGIALQRGDIDAVFTFAVTFGQIEAAGIKLAYLPLPPNVPKIGGFYLSTSPDLLREKRSMIVGIGRAVAKAHVFMTENSEAAAWVFGQIAPEAMPRGKSDEEQVRTIQFSLDKQIPYFKHYDAAIKQAGFTKPSEWTEEVAFLELQDKLKDASGLYSNELIEEINRFDVEKVRAQARDFKLPYKK